MISFLAHSHDITQDCHGKSLLMLPYEVISCIDSFAKKAVAFLRYLFQDSFFNLRGKHVHRRISVAFSIA
jgi:hypothetical protein